MFPKICGKKINEEPIGMILELHLPMLTILQGAEIAINIFFYLPKRLLDINSKHTSPDRQPTKSSTKDCEMDIVIGTRCTTI